MAESKTKKQPSSLVKKHLLTGQSKAIDIEFEGRLTELGLDSGKLAEPIATTLSALLERIDDLTRELDNSRREFNELEQLVDVDCLAPVPNRRAFMRRLEWAVSMLQRYGHPCSILYFDLNGFKQINDEHSHAAGDEVIRAVAEVITQSLRASDFMARLGGDEFAVLLYHAKIDAARRRANVIARRIAETPIAWRKGTLRISSAVGAYEVEQGETAQRALEQADRAMYGHKKSLNKV